MGDPGALEIPRSAALRNVLKAALLSRPTGEALPRPERVPPEALFDWGSSRLPTSSQPPWLPEKTSGWQSCPAAITVSSLVQVRATSGRIDSLMLYTAGPPGYTIEMELSWPRNQCGHQRESLRTMTHMHVLAKASTSPEGEKATSCTQPPEGLAYSPQMVLKGSFSPQTEAAGLIIS